ncbi:adenine phosphoribosyltransferase [Persicobacter psychrovividus]|uniref:Adenine phosphoribosyltransferase n=1 Tax=Persicobacter psychrovividus TaxID=387638 RepID=A0ABM7VH82_9BACT|nr:adenine phosphoribosyltransferase [Persicobacter psychrovividus]
MNIEYVKSVIRNVPDFPKPGIQFKDITTALKDPKALSFMIDHLYEYYKDKGITKVAGIESRGFIIGPALAARLGAGFVMIRKPGKLPADTIQKSYALEYGEDTIEMHKDAIGENDVVLVHDDLLATGGTALAALELVQEVGAKSVLVNFLIELAFLDGTARLSSAEDVYAMIKY